MQPLHTTKPSARAANAGAAELKEEQLEAAVRWLRAHTARKHQDAVDLGRWPLVGSAGALRKQAAERREDGTRFQRKDNELCTTKEKEQLRQRCLEAGFRGEQ